MRRRSHGGENCDGILGVGKRSGGRIRRRGRDSYSDRRAGISLPPPPPPPLPSACCLQQLHLVPPARHNRVCSPLLFTMSLMDFVVSRGTLSGLFAPLATLVFRTPLAYIVASPALSSDAVSRRFPRLYRIRYYTSRHRTPDVGKNISQKSLHYRRIRQSNVVLI